MLNALIASRLEQLLGDVEDGGPGVVDLHGDSLSIDRSVVKGPRCFSVSGGPIEYDNPVSSVFLECIAGRPGAGLVGIRMDDSRSLGETRSDMRAWICPSPRVSASRSCSSASGQGPSQDRAAEDGARRALHLAGMRHVPRGGAAAGRARREEPSRGPDRLPRRLLQRPLEGPVLRQAPQRAPGGLQRALHQAEEPGVRPLLHAHGHGRRRPVGERPRSRRRSRRPSARRRPGSRRFRSRRSWSSRTIGSSGDLRISLAPRSPRRSTGAKSLVCAVLTTTWSSPRSAPGKMPTRP